VSGYDRFGGVHPETGMMANVLRAAGVADPATGKPFDEPALYGLSGGIGFMAFVFEYRDMPPMFTLVLRSDPYPEAFVHRGLERAGARLDVHHTGSARAAATRLDAALDAGSALICTADQASLAYHGLPAEFSGYGPREVAVAGRSIDRATLALDDRAPRPILFDRVRFATARGAYRKGRHRSIAVAPGPGRDPAEAALEAIRGTVRGFREAPVAGFASNFGIAGLERWARLVGDRKDPRGWPRLLQSGAALAGVLAQLYTGIELEHTAPAGGRALYAAFLDRAADLTGRSELAGVASRYRELGVAWSGLAQAALDERDPHRRALREALEERLRLVDELGADAAEPALAAWSRRLELQRVFEVSDAERLAIVMDLAERAAALVGAERAALAALDAAAS
jgi:hypothetical protein